MNRANKREPIIARLISNTRRKKRPDNLLDIARDIRWLEDDFGSLTALSRAIGISTDMLRQFLSIEQLCPEVQKLFEERKFDLINIAHYISNFDSSAQKVIANEVINGRLSAADIRVLAPLRKSLSQFNIHELIARVQNSRDIKTYVAYFHIPPGFENISSLETSFEKIVGDSEIVSFIVQDQVGILELTYLGQKKLKEAAKEHNLSLRKFVDKLVLEQY